MKKNGEGSKTILCSSKTRKDSSECWKKSRYMKERYQKWKSLSSFWEVLGKQKKNAKHAMDGRDKERIK